MAPVTIAGALAQQNAEALAVHRLHPDGAAGRAGDLWRLHLERRHEDRRAGLRHAGIRPRRDGRRPARPALQPALPLVATPAPPTPSTPRPPMNREMSIWGAVMGDANLVMHGAGWMEGGLVASFEKLIVDAEMLQMMAEFLQPIVVDEDTLAPRRPSPRSGRAAISSARPHPGALRDRVLRADPVGLAQLRDLARRPARADTAERANEHLEAAAGRLPAAAARPGDRRGAAGLRRPAQGARAASWRPEADLNHEPQPRILVMLVSIFGFFGSRAQASAEADFWKWFQRNEVALFEFEHNQEAIFDRLAAEMHKVHPSLTFEFGPKENGRREFVISADGIKDAFPKVKSLYASAPAMARWKFVKFRPRRAPFDIEYAGLSVKADTVFVSLKRWPKDGVDRLHTWLQPGRSRHIRRHSVSAARPGPRGVRQVETRVGFIDVKAPTPERAQARTLQELPKAFDDFFAGR